MVSREKPGLKDNAKHPRWASGRCAVSLTERGSDADLAVELLCAGLARLPKLKRVRDPAAREAITALQSGWGYRGGRGGGVRSSVWSGPHPCWAAAGCSWGMQKISQTSCKALQVLLLVMVVLCVEGRVGHVTKSHVPVDPVPFLFPFFLQRLRTRHARHTAACSCMATLATARMRRRLPPSPAHGASHAKPCETCEAYAR